MCELMMMMMTMKAGHTFRGNQAEAEKKTESFIMW